MMNDTSVFASHPDALIFFFFPFLAELAKFFLFTVTLPTFHYCGGAQGNRNTH